MKIEKDDNGNLAFLCIENKKVLLSLIQKPKIRRVTIRFSPDRKTLFITAPLRARISALEDFLSHAHAWIRKKLSLAEEELLIQNGSEVTLFGQTYTVKLCRGIKNKVWKEAEIIIVQVKHERHLQKTWEDFFKEEAARFFTSACHAYAKQIGIFPKGIKVRDFKSRWGSCAHTGILSFSWRLAFAPISVAHYVAAHEVAHLKVPNHSSKFWKQVEALYSSYGDHRAWLKKKGASLFLIKISKHF